MGDVGHSTEGAEGDSLAATSDSIESGSIETDAGFFANAGSFAGNGPVQGTGRQPATRDPVKANTEATPHSVPRDVSGVYVRSAHRHAAGGQLAESEVASDDVPVIPAVVVVRWGGSAEVRVLSPGDSLAIDTGGSVDRALAERLHCSRQDSGSPSEAAARREANAGDASADAWLDEPGASGESAATRARAPHASSRMVPLSDAQGRSPMSFGGVHVECNVGPCVRVRWLALEGQGVGRGESGEGSRAAAEVFRGLGVGSGDGDGSLSDPDGLLLEPGEEVQLGDLALAAVPWAPEESGRVRVLSHDAFVGRVREEMARRGRALKGGTLALVQLRQVRREQETLRDLLKLRPGDLVGAFAASVLEFYLPETTEAEALSVVERVFEKGRVLKLSCAAHPSRGTDLDSLLAAALAGLRGDDGLRFGDHFIATDTRMSRLVEKAEGLAKSSLAVVIEGESGAGKRSLVRAVHSKVFGQDAPWIEAQGLAGLIDFERALRGDIEPTLVLVDPHLLPEPEQVMIARRLSLSAAPKWVACLINGRLDELVGRKRIDGELASLLASFGRVAIPALRERPMDLIPLAMSSLERLAPGSSHRLSVSAMAHLATHDWPGNVRELQVVLDRALRLAGQGSIHIEHLPIGEATGEASVSTARGQARLKQHVDSLERHAIEQAMADANFNQTHAARRLGISRRALIYKLEKYGLKAPAGSLRPGRAAS